MPTPPNPPFFGAQSAETADALELTGRRAADPDRHLLVRVGRLAIADPIRGMDFGTRHVLLALDAGEPYRVARAAGYSSTAGSKALARTESLIAAATDLAHRVGHPHAIGLANLTTGTAVYLQGQWSRAMELLAQAEKILRERCTGVTWDIDTAVVFHFRALLWLGHYGEICRRLPALLADVSDRGDHFAETGLRTRVAWVAHLVRTEPDLAHEEADQAIQRWSQQGFNLQHYWHLTAMTELAMYRGLATAGSSTSTYLEKARAQAVGYCLNGVGLVK